MSVPFSYIPNSPLCPVHATLHAFSFHTKIGKDQAFSYFDHLTFVPNFRYIKNSWSNSDIWLTLVWSLPHFDSHSFHRGGASFAFQAGVATEMTEWPQTWKTKGI